MRVDIWSDLVCPWCYVGKRRFERALARLDGGVDVEVIHHAFQLNPQAPRDSTTDRREMLARKYRLSSTQVDEMDARMTDVAAAEGLEYHLEGTRSGNTFDAHQIVQLAGERGIQDAVIERLYRAYFVEGRSLFEHDSLVSLAAEAGLDAEEASAALREERYRHAVEEDLQAAARIGISGVPFFVLDNRLGVSGAQSPDVFVNAIQQATATEKPR